MKIPNPFLFLAAAFLAIGPLAPRQARAQVSVSFFYDNLDPYGEWVQTADYGYVWHPTGVDENWAPYTDGYWAYTDSGWTWVSYEDYGGVVYHYGRWAHIPGEGWCWTPGYQWAPAWVSWRCNDDYVGWAPLPPEAHWRAGFGFGGGVDASFGIGPGFYSFVGVHDFGAPALAAVIVNREQNVNIISRTTNITNITVNNSNVFVGGPSYSKFSALSSRPIPTLKLVRQANAASAGGKILSRQQGNQLMVVAPKITAPAGGVRPAPPKVAKNLGEVKADHGWAIVKDPEQREKLQAQFKEQAGSKGQAKSVNPEDLKVVNDKFKGGGGSKKLAADEAVEPGKSKKEKSATDFENAPATEEPGLATETPKKAKKTKAPEDETGDYETKHSKKSSDTGLQPFTSDEGSKPKKSAEDSGKSQGFEETGKHHPAEEARTPRVEKSDKGDKDEKSDKKRKEDEGQ